MADNSHIEWTDATWNPVTGCSIVSPGCTNCYAMKLAGTRLRNHPSRKGLTTASKSGPVWNGTVRFNEEWLLQPLSWKKPRMIFVCAHGDLFHEDVPDEWIDQVFAVMALTTQHTFQVLTKRSKRMRDYVNSLHNSRALASIVAELLRESELGPRAMTLARTIPNVWLGVSVERQKEADERIPDLLATPAAVRFISAEPLLGPLDLNNVPSFADLHQGLDYRIDALSGMYKSGIVRLCATAPKLDWVIVGGESGDGARAMHPDWARALRNECEAAGVAFFFKQWGNWAPSTPEQATGNPRSGWKALSGNVLPKAAELYPNAGAAFVEHMLKATAGRLLDGVEHNGMPVRP